MMKKVETMRSNINPEHFFNGFRLATNMHNEVHDCTIL